MLQKNRSPCDLKRPGSCGPTVKQTCGVAAQLGAVGLASVFGNPLKHLSHRCPLVRLDEVDQAGADLAKMLGSDFVQQLHAVIGETGKRAPAIFGAFLSLNQVSLNQAVNPLGCSAP